MIIVCGDVHGEWKAFTKKIVDNDIFGARIIVAGDCGFGFYSVKRDIDLLVSLNEFCFLRNIMLHLIRGNHDNPMFWIHYKHDDFKNIIFEKDYQILFTDGLKKICCIGGAVSIDRNERTEYVDWWANEVIIKSDVVSNAQIVISHDCPTFVAPLDFKHQRNSQAYENAKILDEFYDREKPNLWVHGHYHISKTTFFEHTKFVSLDILEFYQI